MAETQPLLPVSAATFCDPDEVEGANESPRATLSSFKLRNFHVWYGTSQHPWSVRGLGDKFQKAREHWPYARQLFFEIFSKNPPILSRYILLVLVLAISPALSLCLCFRMLLLVEQGLQGGGTSEGLIADLRVCATAWLLMSMVNIHAKHESHSIELSLQAHLRGLWDDLIRKSLQLDIDTFTRYSLDFDYALPSQGSFSFAAPCYAFVHDMIHIPSEVIMLVAQILALFVVSIRRGFDQSLVLLLFAIIQPVVIWSCPVNSTKGQGFAFWTPDSSFYRVAQLFELATDLNVRRTLMKDNACTALARKYAEVSAELSHGNVPPAPFAMFLARWLPWYWSMLSGFILDEPLALCAFILPWSQPISSLVTMIILQQTTQFLRDVRNRDATSSLDKFIASLCWAKSGYYDVMKLPSSITSGCVLYPPALASSAGMKIELKDVAFTHGPHFKNEVKLPAVKNLTFMIPPGSLVAVAGSNGSGKSSLLGLLTRTWPASEGQILIDDEPVENYDLALLRDAIAGVEQDEDLYPGISLRESILLGLQPNDKADEEKILCQAARMGCATEIIEGLPEKWETIIYPTQVTFSSEGTGLTPIALEAFQQVDKLQPRKTHSFSGGEMQRLTATRMFARLLLLGHRARLVVWDEATSKMDPFAEREILASLKGQRSGRTIVVATHDYRQWKEADLVLVLKDGRLVEMGTHEGLLSNAGGEAPAFGARSPPKPRSVDQSAENQSLDPEKWSVKDTSVNIAAAFHQAATDMTTPNNAWASGQTRTTVPRSTSVEYEQTQQSTSTRRLPPPPSKLSRKPIPKNPSIRHVPDSEGEESQPQPQSQPQPVAKSATRGKSPFEQVVGAAKRAIISVPAAAAAATYYVRQRSQEPDEPVAVNGSYEYTAEERDIQSQSRRTAPAHKRNRISVDNKAYRPSNSDLENSDEDFTDDDGKKKRRKKKKKDSVGGPLTSLPVAGYDKRKKKARKSKGNADEMEEGSDSESHATERQSAPRGSLPPARRSVPPEPSFNVSLQEPLVPIHEAEKEDEDEDEDEEISEAQHQRPRSLSRAPSQPPRNPGAVFGTLAYAIFTVFLLFGRTLGTTAEVLLLRPIRATARKAIVGPILKFTLFGLFVVLATRMIPDLDMRIPWGQSSVFRPPEAPAANIAEISERLRRMETSLSRLSLDSEVTRTKLDEETRLQADMAGKVVALETRVKQETVRALEAEVASRDVAASGLKNMKKDLEALQALVQVLQQQPHQGSGGVSGSDEEARLKLKALEERLGTVEAGVREAIDLGKKNSGPGSSVGATWWSKSASKSGVTIKSSDGQDVTHVIADLVSKAVGLSGRDMRTDFAMHSSGAYVIPSLTTDTYAIRPSTFTGKVVGFVTGNGHQIGAPPVVALHHDIHDGRCWPFAGSQGQLAVVLAAPVHIEDFTIDHVSAETAVNMRTSAPRDMEVWALVEHPENLAKLKAWRNAKAQRRANGETVDQEPKYPKSLPSNGKTYEYIRIATFRYDVLSPNNIQTFPIDPEIKDLEMDFGIVILMVKNNWGMDAFTCLYRFRVHGQKVNASANAFPPELLSA
ncbi:hypothetical protein C8F01DRAFT_1247427 [Mycena amicta]|nr:hypothetical protein C8F01DRAFT_1247427 [Mycena amicta]